MRGSRVIYDTGLVANIGRRPRGLQSLLHALEDDDLVERRRELIGPLERNTTPSKVDLPLVLLVGFRVDVGFLVFLTAGFFGVAVDFLATAFTFGFFSFSSAGVSCCAWKLLNPNSSIETSAFIMSSRFRPMERGTMRSLHIARRVSAFSSSHGNLTVAVWGIVLRGSVEGCVSW